MTPNNVIINHFILQSKHRTEVMLKVSISQDWNNNIGMIERSVYKKKAM